MLYDRSRLQRDMCCVLRTRLPPALAVGRVMLSVEFHIRRSHCHRTGRTTVRRRFRHQYISAIPAANVFRRLHAYTTGINHILPINNSSQSRLAAPTRVLAEL